MRKEKRVDKRLNVVLPAKPAAVRCLGKAFAPHHPNVPRGTFGW